MRLPLICTLLLSLTLYGQETEPAAEENPEWEKLQNLAEAFLTAYNAKDAAAVAALMTEDGEMVREDGSRVEGRAEIETFYGLIFEEAPEAQAALEATSIRFLSPILAVEEGAMHITEGEDGEPASFLYTALHVKQEDGSWLTARTRDREVANLVAHEALVDVDGLVGDWVAQTDAGSLELAFSFDESGSFLLGKAVYKAAGIEPITVSMRIGWDSLRQRIVSWTWDAEGGHSKAEWTNTEDSWVVKASGYTSDGEITSSTQIITPLSADSFTWRVTDKFIGEELGAERELRMVRRPPKPNLSAK